MSDTPTPARDGTTRWAVVAAAAAVVVIIGGFVLLRGLGSEGTLTPVPTSSANATVATPTGASTGSATGAGPTAPAAIGALDLSGLPTGAPPAIAYLQGGTLHLPDGTTVVPDTDFRARGVARLADQTTVYLTQERGDSGFSVEVITADGRHYGPVPSGYSLAVQAEHTAVAWISGDQHATLWQVGGARPVEFPRAFPGSESRIAAVLGECTYTSDCRVFASGWDEQGPAGWVTTPTGSVTLADPERRLIGARDAFGTRLLGYTRIGDNDSESAVVDTASSDRTVVWRTTEHTLDAFSPDGRYVLAGPAYRDGIGDGEIALYDEAGNLLVVRKNSQAAPGFLQHAVWEDETHVLFEAYQDGSWSIVRLDVTGALEFAVAPIPGNSDRNPFHLEATP